MLSALYSPVDREACTNVNGELGALGLLYVFFSVFWTSVRDYQRLDDHLDARMPCLSERC